MKHLFIIATLFLVGSLVKAQSSCTPPVYFFNSISNVSGTGGVGSVYRFTNSISGVNAFVTITKLQNATITNSNMDINSSFPLAWQPTIRFTSSKNAGDSSYIEFNIKFIQVGSGANLNSINNAVAKQTCMAMTVVDCDGPGNSNTYREMVKVSLPATPIGIANSTINVSQDAKWIKLVSGSTQFSNIDTTDYAAMAQINFPVDTKDFTLRVGAVGAVTANLDRQFSFYFKNFSGLNFVLPVNLVNFNTTLADQKNALLTWTTASEQDANRFEIYRSFDGRNFVLAGNVNASGNSNEFRNYSFTDFNILDFNQTGVFYKLKMVENNGAFQWSFISKVRLKEQVSGSGSVSVFPNPSTKTMNIDLSGFVSQDISLEIVDIYGKCVQRIESPDLTSNQLFQMNVSELNRGMYFIRIKDNNGEDATTVKFVKE